MKNMWVVCMSRCKETDNC